LLTLVSQHLLKEEMEVVTLLQNLELWTIWLLKSIWNSHIKENLLIFSLVQLFSLLWLLSILHSLQLNLLIHSIDVWQLTEQTFSGELIARVNLVVKDTSLKNSKILCNVCSNWILLTDHQCLKSWLIHGCKEKLLVLKKSLLNSKKETRLSKILLNLIKNKRMMRKQEEWKLEKLQLPWEAVQDLKKSKWVKMLS